MAPPVEHACIDLGSISIDVDTLMMGPYVYEQGWVNVISAGQTHTVHSISDYVKLQGKPVKVEAMERYSKVLWDVCTSLGKHYNHSGPVSCHLFISPEGSVSFPMHTDLEDVIIYMVSGSKCFEFSSGQMTLDAGDSIYIPKGVAHRAINVKDSLMLSFGLESFTESKL